MARIDLLKKLNSPRRRKALRKPSRPVRPSAIVRIERLEERVVMDSSIYQGGLEFVAVGPLAAWTNSVSLGKDLKSLPVANSLFDIRSAEFQVHSTDSPVQVYKIENEFYGPRRISGVLFGMPSGAEVRETAGYRYSDVVPRWGLVTVATGISPTATTSSQQTIRLLTPAPFISESYSYKLNETYAILNYTSATTDSDIAASLNSALANPFGPLKGLSAAVRMTSDEGGYRTYSVTFTGPNAQATPLLDLTRGYFNTHVVGQPISEVTITRYDTSEQAKANNGIGQLVLETDNLFATRVENTYPGLTYNSSIKSFWEIPTSLQASFPVVGATNFTATSFGPFAYSSSGMWETRILGAAQYQSFVGSLKVGDPIAQNAWSQYDQPADGRYSRVTAGALGLQMVYPSRSGPPAFALAPTTDANGQPRPVTFAFAGLNFALSDDGLPPLIYDASTRLYNSTTPFVATAPFQGGQLTVQFSGVTLDPVADRVTLPAPTFVSLQLGGFVVAPSGLKMTYDAATQQFRLAFDGLTLDGSSLTAGNARRYITDRPSLNIPYPNYFDKQNSLIIDYVDPNGLSVSRSIPAPSGPVTLPVLQDLVGRSCGGTVTSDGPHFVIETRATIKGLRLIQRSRDTVTYPTVSTVNFNFLAAPISDPAQIVVGAGAFSLTAGRLDPILGLPVVGARVGRIVGNAVSWIDLSPTGRNLNAAFYPDGQYDASGMQRIPSNTWAVYGQAVTPLSVPNVSLPGVADLGVATPPGAVLGAGQAAPGLLVTNARVNRLSFAVSQVTVDGRTFQAAAVPGAGPFSVDYTPPVGSDPQVFEVKGGATMQPVGGYFTSPVGVILGGGASDGLRLYPQATAGTPDYTLSFTIAGAFTAGTETLTGASGANGLKISYDPKTKNYTITGDAYLNLSGPSGAAKSLAAGAQLLPGGSMLSGNGAYRLTLQADGNLVWYEVATGRPLWATGTWGKSVTSAVMQTDGNLVLYNGPQSMPANAQWSSSTYGNPGAYLALGNDGSLVLSRSDGTLLKTLNAPVSGAAASGAGQGLLVSATVPAASAGFAPNLLNATTLNFFFSDRTSFNGFNLTPQETSNPLRAVITPTADQIVGDFSMRLDDRNLLGTVPATPLVKGALPTSGLPLDFSRTGAGVSWSLGGVLLSGIGTATLAKTLQLPINTTLYEGKPLGTAVITAANGKATAATITGANQQVGDVFFKTYTATYNFQTTPAQWVFTGSGTYFGKPVTVGTGANDVKVKIGATPNGSPQETIGSAPTPTQKPQAPPATFTLAGITFDTSGATKDAVQPDPSSVIFTLGLDGYQVNVGRAALTLGGSLSVRVDSNGNASLYKLAASVQSGSTFTFGAATFSVNSLKLAYFPSGVINPETGQNDGKPTFAISGDASFRFTAAKASVNMNVKLGDDAGPGLLIEDGVVTALKVSVSGSFNLMSLTLTVPTAAAGTPLTLEYDAAKSEYAIYGDVILSTALQSNGKRTIDNLTVNLGKDKDSPGILVADGSVQAVDVTVNGDINLFGLTASPRDLRVQYTAASNQLEITGGVSITLTSGMVLTAALPGGGLLIDTGSGAVQVQGVRLQADGDIRFGALTVKNLYVEYTNQSGAIGVEAGALLSMPSGLEVGGSFQVINGKLNAISFTFSKNPGILVANGLINIYSISGSVKNLTDLNNFELSATVKATVGPAVMFAGQTYALVDVSGTITVNTKSLTLSGQANLVGGLFGKGDFTGTLTWDGTPNVRFNANVQLYPGGILRGTLSAYVDVSGNVDFNSSIGVYVPNGVPIAGGSSLGQLVVSLRVRPAEPQSQSYVSFTAKVLNVNGGVTARFDKSVDYSLRADFWLFSTNYRGRFTLRDLPETPTLEILSAQAIPGTEDARIVFDGYVPNGDSGATVDLYADTTGSGQHGLLIASDIPVDQLQQTFVWKDMAALAPDGQPVYVYGVIRDPNQAAAQYSAYSAPFTTTLGFAPSVTLPSLPLNFQSGVPLVFSSATGTGIAVTDPRQAEDPTRRVQVRLNIGSGALDLPREDDLGGVVVTGDGTDEVTLDGTAAAITAALDGLTYIPSNEAFQNQRLTASASLLPLEELTPAATGSVDLVYQPMSVILEQEFLAGGLPSTTIVRGREGATPLEDVLLKDADSDNVTGARITIVGYVPGRDVLDFSVDAELTTGLLGSFDSTTGVLSLTGDGDRTTYEDALSKVTFSSTDAAGVRLLSVAVADDLGHRAGLDVPMTLIDGAASPTVGVDATGPRYTPGAPVVAVASGALVTSPTGLLAGATIAFTPETYHPGEDVLSYGAGASPVVPGIAGSFDAATGVLTLTGLGTADAYTRALHAVGYQGRVGTSTAGLRGLVVTVTQDDPNAQTGSATIEIAVGPAGTAYAGPSLSFSNAAITLPSGLQEIGVDPGLSLTDDVPTFTGATVVIGNDRPGEDVLGLSDLPAGIVMNFDEGTGVLTLSGVASVEAYQDALRGLLYQNMTGDRKGRSLDLTLSVADGVSPAVSKTLTLAIAGAPYLDAGLGDSVEVKVGASSTPIDAGLTVHDASGTLTGARIWIAANDVPDEDSLTFTARAGIGGSFDPASGVLTLSGPASVADYQAVLDSIRYVNALNNPVDKARVVRYQVQDGAVLSNVAQATVMVDAPPVGPTITAGRPGPAFVERGPAVAIAPNLTLTPADAVDPSGSAAHDLYGAVVAVDQYVRGEDLLNFTDTAEITGSFDAASGELILTGAASFDAYQAALRSITYRNLAEAPLAGPRSATIRLDDGGGDGLSDSVRVGLTVEAIPDAPRVTSGALIPLTLLENAAPAPLGLGVQTFATPDPSLMGSTTLAFTPTVLPAETLGEVELADGTALTIGVTYSASALVGLRFAPAPDATGQGLFSFQVAFQDSLSGALNPGALAESLPIEVIGVATSTPSQAFVAQVFRDLTGSNPTPAALKDWAGRLDAALAATPSIDGSDTGPPAREGVVSAILATEGAGPLLVDEAYRSLLGRPATLDEAAAGLAFLRSGGTPAALRGQVAGTTEYHDRHADLGEASYVESLYVDLLGRSPADDLVDPTSPESAQVAQLQAGTVTPASVAATVAAMPEAVRPSNETIFAGLLRRTPTTDDLASYGPDLANPDPTGLIADLVSSPEYASDYQESSSALAATIPDQPTSSFPAVGKLGDASGDKAGGTLIAPQYVLAAAHSVDGVPAGGLTFTLGGVVHRVISVVVHPQYRPGLLGSPGANDLALLKLDEPVTGIAPATLLDGTPAIGTSLELVGFGQHNGTGYGVERVGTTPPVDSVSRSEFTWTYRNPAQTDSAAGDSGSPLFLVANGAEYIAGIVSGGTTSGPGDVATNTAVGPNLAWIRSVVGAISEGPTSPAISLTHPVPVAGATPGTVIGTLVGFEGGVASRDTFSLVSGAGDADNLRFTINGDRLVLLRSDGVRAADALTVRVRAVDPSGIAIEFPLSIDTGPPTSAVAPLSATSASPEFAVVWSGSDGAGSGIASYSVFVSADGGPFVPWIVGTSQTSAVFAGQVGHSYAFYSIATDGAGFVQPTPARPQAATLVAASISGPTIAQQGHPYILSLTVGGGITGWEVSWGDGHVQMVAGGEPIVSHIYDRSERVTISAVASTRLGAVAAVPVIAVAVLPPGPPIGPAPTPHSIYGAGADAFVETLYGEILGRDVEQSGLDYWARRLALGFRPSSIARGIELSRERSGLGGHAPKIPLRTALSDALQARRTAVTSPGLHQPGRPLARRPAK